MGILEELTELNGEEAEVFLLDWGLQPHDRQVLIVQSVAPGGVDLIAEKRIGLGILNFPAKGHVGAWVDGEVCDRGFLRGQRRVGGSWGKGRGRQPRVLRRLAAFIRVRPFPFQSSGPGISRPTRNHGGRQIQSISGAAFQKGMNFP